MTEYRVVCTRDRWGISGKVHHYDEVCCWYGTGLRTLQTFDKRKAMEYLKTAIEECPKFDALTQKGREQWRQTNIRIQTREVTEWTDKEGE